MTSRKHIKIFYFNGVNVTKHWYVAGEVFAISNCLVPICQESPIDGYWRHSTHWKRTIVTMTTLHPKHSHLTHHIVPEMTTLASMVVIVTTVRFQCLIRTTFNISEAITHLSISQYNRWFAHAYNICCHYVSCWVRMCVPMLFVDRCFDIKLRFFNSYYLLFCAVYDYEITAWLAYKDHHFSRLYHFALNTALALFIAMNDCQALPGTSKITVEMQMLCKARNPLLPTIWSNDCVGWEIHGARFWIHLVWITLHRLKYSIH